MSEKSMFFNSTEEDIREYSAGDFSEFFGGLHSTGIINGLAASLSSDRSTVTIGSGNAIINGYYYSLTEDMQFTAESGSRQDMIVLQLDTTERKISLIYKKGTGSSEPEIVQSGNIYEIPVLWLLTEADTSTFGTVSDRRIFSRVVGSQAIYRGKSTPDSSKGQNGDIYILY